MKYFLIAGETSGDLHASHLIKALKSEDPNAQFKCYGGDYMQSEGGELLCHYKHLAYMGFIPVIMHARTILKGLANCKRQIKEWKPDVVILVDYPGFNLKIAQYVHDEGICPVFYYISPKIWAWKEHRIKEIRKNVDRLFSILPFEIDFFEKKHHYPISYVGNPTVDEIHQFHTQRKEEDQQPPSSPRITLLPGSRIQEIKDNLPIMLEATYPFLKKNYTLQICVAPSIKMEIYKLILMKKGIKESDILFIEKDTYSALFNSEAALVTSGTATLETALLKVPQVVCYYISCGWLISILRKLFLKVPYISLVNLVCGKEVVRELVANDMNVKNLQNELNKILVGGEKRETQLRNYEDLEKHMGKPGAPQRAAQEMVSILKNIS